MIRAVVYGTVTLHLASTHSPQYKLLAQYGIDATI